MTAKERDKCRRIAARLDAGDLSVCEEDAAFISRHRGEIWSERAAQRTKAARVHPCGPKSKPSGKDDEPDRPPLGHDEREDPEWPDEDEDSEDGDGDEEENGDGDEDEGRDRESERPVRWRNGFPCRE